MSRPEEQPITTEQLQQPGLVEDLVRSGRVPHLIGSDSSSYHCFVPPTDTQLGDTRKWVTGIGFVYFSPTGEQRGDTIVLSVDREQSLEIIGRIRTTLIEMEVIKPRKTVWQRLRSWSLFKL